VSDRPLQIEFQRSGGVAGAILTTTVDARELREADAAELTELVGRADIPALAESAGGPGAGRPDRFQYDLSITIDDRRYEVSLGEAEVPETLRPLLDRLLELARRR
jgi:hypothetical protein